MKNEKKKIEIIKSLHEEATMMVIDSRKAVTYPESYKAGLVKHFGGRLCGIEAVCYILGIGLPRSKVFNYEPREGE